MTRHASNACFIAAVAVALGSITLMSAGPPPGWRWVLDAVCTGLILVGLTLRHRD
jgi:hypothetical protein